MRTAGRLLCLVLSAALTSCAAHREASVPTLHETTAHAGPTQVSGYTTTDGRYHSFRGVLRLAGDTIELAAPARRSHGLSADIPEQVIILPRDLVASVTLEEGTDVPLSILAAIGFLAFCGLMALAGISSTPGHIP